MRLIIFFVAIVLAVGVFMLTSQLTSKPKDTSLPVVEPQIVVKDAPTVDIYTAKRDIEIGAIIRPEMLDIQPFPKNLLLDDMIQADPNNASPSIVKMVARTPFQKGEPIFMSKLGNEKDPTFVAASLPKGMRVVTIAVDSMSGVGNFIYPGDRVDVLITHDVNMDATATSMSASPASSTPAAASKKTPVTEILLHNIKILAVNQKIIRGNEPPSGLSNVSLEVTPEDAQRVRLTENGNGRLSLALRSLKDREAEDYKATPTTVSDLSHITPPSSFPILYNNGKATGPEKKEEDTPMAKTVINVIRGNKVESVEVSQP